MIINRNRSGDDVYIIKRAAGRKESSHGIMAKEMAVEGAITSFKLLMSLYL